MSISGAVMQFIAFRTKSIKHQLIDKSEISADEFNSIEDGKTQMEVKLGTSSVEQENISKDKVRKQLNMAVLTKSKRGNCIVDISIELQSIFEFNLPGISNGEVEYNEEEILVKNGSAILFPYARSLIHNITGFDTDNNVVKLPTLNLEHITEDN